MRGYKRFLLLPMLALIALSSCEKQDENTPVDREINPYINRVLEYCPAPGQFINKLPLLAEGESEETILARCTETIANNARGTICLGGFGGYITFSFDHAIINREGRDLMIHGNAFRDPSSREYGNSEPGGVMVMMDKNGNGLPDDGEWFELKGAGYDLPETTKNYEITYHSPNSDGEIQWSDNQGESGIISKNSYHTQPYWPLNRMQEESIAFRGTRLNNVVQKTGDTYSLKIWEFGYVDNLPNNEEEGFDLSWAINGKGEPVYLDSIHFVRVYCCVNERAGWIGEVSTEVTNAWDLNLLDETGRPRGEAE